MIRTAKLALLGLVVVALTVGSSVAQAQGMAVDETKAKRGKSLFQNRGCVACHAFGKKLGGPDLVGVMDRRDHAWLRRWLSNTTEMLASDSLAQALLAEYKGVKMPNLKLSDADIDALFHYMQQESDKKKSS